MEAAIEKKKRDPELSNLDNRGRAWWTRRGGGRRRRRWARRPRRRGGAERGWRGRPWWGRVGRGRTRASPGTLPAARSPPPLSPRRRTSARSGTTPFLGRRRPSTVANRVLRCVSPGVRGEVRRQRRTAGEAMSVAVEEEDGGSGSGRARPLGLCSPRRTQSGFQESKYY